MKDEILLKIAKAIDWQYGCSGCPYEDGCLQRADEQCVEKLVDWLKTVIK